MARLFCVGRNYPDHARELGNEVPAEPVIFMKPLTAIQKLDGKPMSQIQIPRGSGEVHYEAELVFKLGDNNRLEAMTLGLDLTLRDRQKALKQKGLPWEAAKAFDGSAPLGPWIPIEQDSDLEFELLINQQRMQHGRIRDQLFSPETVITAINTWAQTHPGDMIMTGTPAGVGPLQVGQEGSLRLFTSKAELLFIPFIIT